MTCSFGHGNEISGSRKGRRFLDWMNDCQLLKENSFQVIQTNDFVA